MEQSLNSNNFKIKDEKKIRIQCLKINQIIDFIFFIMLNIKIKNKWLDLENDFWV